MICLLIFGLSYAGCVSLGCLAKNRHTVVTVEHEVQHIDEGKPPIIKKGMDNLAR